MSHLCTIKTELRDIEAIRDACKELGWTLHNGGRVRYYMGEADEVDFTIEFNGKETISSGLERGKYNIGLVKSNTGYEIKCDNAMHGMEILPEDEQDSATKEVLSKLKQQYAVACVKKQAKRKRLRVEQRIGTDGTIHMTLKGRF